MPIDPSIPLQVRPVQVQDPLEVYAKVSSLANAQQQRQMNALQLMQLQNALNEEESFKQAIGRGASPNELMSIAPSKAAAYLKAQSEQHKVDLESQTKELEVQGTKLKRFASIAGAITDEDGFRAGINMALTEGLISPEEAQTAMSSPWNAQTEARLKLMANSAMTRAEQLQQTQREIDNRRAQAEFDATLPGKAADSNAKARQNAASLLGSAKNQAMYRSIWNSLSNPTRAQFPEPDQWTPETPEQVLRLGMTPEQQIQSDQAAANAAETKAQHEAERARWKVVDALAARRTAAQEGTLNLTRQRYGWEMGGGVSPQAQAAAEGKIAPQTLRAMLRSNPGLVGQIRSVDPNFDEATLDKRYQTLQEFNSTSNSKAGGQIIALNTLIHHADLYQQVGEALKNGAFRPGNAAYNALATAFGAAPPTQADLVARFLAGETGKVATGGVPAEGEINGVLKNLRSDSSPDQFINAGRTILQIAAGRMVPLQERVQQDKLDRIVHVLGPDAQEILRKRGFDPSTMKPAAAGASATGVSVVAPNGKTYTFPDQASANAFKKQAGVK